MSKPEEFAYVSVEISQQDRLTVWGAIYAVGKGADMDPLKLATLLLEFGNKILREYGATEIAETQMPKTLEDWN